MNQDSIIYFENVSKWFGDFQVLNKINLEVNKGEKNCCLWTIWVR
jgi:ABC-type polar amino acid transport system ATPase subunit